MIALTATTFDAMRHIADQYTGAYPKAAADDIETLLSSLGYLRQTRAGLTMTRC